jgi:carbon-monoxide dehydrogenase small subunit
MTDDPHRRIEVAVVVNGTERHLQCDARTSLVDALREELSLTGTHVGCEHGVCGACTVLLDGLPVRSCLVLAVQTGGCAVTTIEALGTPAAMHPVQAAFAEAMSFQCGYCTPGFVMATLAYLEERAGDGHDEPPDDDEIRTMLTGNICRCTGYQSIVDGVRRAARVWPPRP